MKCPRCQAENREGLRFCEDCGARLAATCASCGAELTPGKRFCGSCGASLAGATQAEARFPSPQAYTPRHLAERIINSKAALEGERKQVTVLFADLKGSMELLADRDPEEARKLLDPVLRLMMEAVHRYEGTVNQVMGDGIMALFGAPLAHEDHAVRACYAALRMQDASKRCAEGVRRAEGIALQIRVGLNSGEVVVRSIGNDLHMDYTAVGQTTHIAARMEQMALPGSILLSARTLDLCAEYVEVKALGPLPVKGLEAPLEVHELTGAATIRSRSQAAAARGLTRFVGRESELQQLSQALERARTGHGQVVSVVGEPGVGKSRLYWEFTHSHWVQGWLVLASASVSYGKATNYLPILELLRAYFAIESSDNARQLREKVTGKLLSLDGAFNSCITPLLWLLDVAVEDEGWERLDPSQRRKRALDAVKRLLLRESQVQPLMVLFEDLHWVDAETQVFLDGLVESLPASRLLLLVNYRPEYSHSWGNKTYYRQLQIAPLPSEGAAALLDALLGSDAALANLKRLVTERTEGNPFFMEETVRSLVETGVLVGSRGTYRLQKQLQILQVPPTAQAMLAARIDRLAPEDKRLLQAAAVIGTEVPLGLLQAVAEEPEDRLRQGLAQLQATEFLYEKRLFPDLEYTFRHALTHEVAYGGLLAARQRYLHARIVEAIERMYPDRLVEHVERLAHHAVRGEVWPKALTYLRQAGSKAAGRSAYPEAVANFEQALGVLTHLSQSREMREEAIDLRLELRQSLFVITEFGRVLDYLREAEALAVSLGDQRRLGLVSMLMTVHFWITGDPERAVEFGERAFTIAEALRELSLQVGANWRLGLVYLALGNYPRAIDHLRRAVALLEGNLSYDEPFAVPRLPSVISRILLAACLAERGEFGEAIIHGEEGVRIAESVDDTSSLIAACNGLGSVHLRKGDVHKAITVLERGLAVGEAANTPLWSFLIASALGSAYALAGQVTKALPLLALAAKGHSIRPALRDAALGEGYLLAGRTEEAVRFAERARALSCDYKERGHEAWASRLLGEIAAHQAPSKVENAEDHYRQAMALAEELGMRPLVAHCHLGLGKLYRHAGKREQAQEHFKTAATMYREMGMTYWLEKAERESRAPT